MLVVHSGINGQDIMVQVSVLKCMREIFKLSLTGLNGVGFFEE